MDKRTFVRLCQLQKIEGRLKENRNMSVREMVISFLHIIAHHMRNKVFKRQTVRFGETVIMQISCYVERCFKAAFIIV